jgi:histone-lysine N-methyltransferase SETMAR
MNKPFRIVIYSCYCNKFSPLETMKFLSNAFGDAAPSKSTIYLWFSKFRRGRYSLEDMKRAGRPRISRLEGRISRKLKQNKFSSIRSIARSLKSSPKTIHRRLKNTMKMKRMKLKVVPHTLNKQNKQQRVILGKRILKQLHVLSHIDVITSDESWFFLSYSSDGMWVKDRSEVEIAEKQSIYSKKIMISIFWNFHNLFLVDCVPVGETYDSDFVIDTLFPKLEAEALNHRPSRGLKSFYLHWDNARPHISCATSEQVERLFGGVLKHPPYSPDVAPSDFFLFGYLKNSLIGKKIDDEEQLKNEITKSFRTITKQTKVDVFNEWKRRLEVVIKNNGNY